MRLHILGKSSDDRGTQLEILTKELLESLGYQRLKMNIANDAGEVDIDGEFITPLPVASKRTRVIAECKAHKDPLNMTDWLKFLGKLFIAEASSDDVTGCLVALSGVNGNVLGSQESLKRTNVRLVESATLVEYLSNSHGLAPRADLLRYLASTGRTHLSIDLAYYQRHVYWVITYDSGNYTVLDAGLTYPTDPTLDLIKPLIESRLEAGAFIDLRKEEAAQQARLLATKLVFSGAMIGNGSTTVTEVLKLLMQQKSLEGKVSAQDIHDAAASMVQLGIMTRDGVDSCIRIPSKIEEDMEARRQLLLEFGRECALLLPIGCPWWDKHIDDGLMRHICRIQGDLDLDVDSQRKVIEVMRLSPSALFYAIVPDPMIVTHRKDNVVVPSDDAVLLHDRNQFMRSLYSGLIRDYENPALAKYFYSERRIDALTRKTHVTVYDRDNRVVIDDGVAGTMVIGEWEKTNANGEPVFIHMSALPSYAEQRRLAAAERAASEGSANSQFRDASLNVSTHNSSETKF